MARNGEKAQSMLYRFREQQAVDMGLGNRVKGDRRPRMASAVTSLRECERWRGDILRDISRKVSKIQDVSLGDYEIRDLNDEINALFREKRHWENQIVNLGGANYKRGNVAMTDDDGREVPGTRGYKYFGRAKDLPGVKELFTRGAQQATEESARNASFQMFRHQGPSYYGDEDEMDQDLAKEEDELARKDWEEAVLATAHTLGIDSEGSTDLPFYPLASTSAAPPVPEPTPAPAAAPATTTKSKRKARNQPNKEEVPVETTEETTDDSAKKAKTDAAGTDSATTTTVDPTIAAAQAQAMSFLNVLDADSLKFPTLPTKDEMAKVLLEVRKKALREEYGV
ncbi:hypothetical protein CI109_103011 [Kwoniella shandongensis]|uniref:Uncharacterized protein n=1 Tax=Kwoniella shandongensis TaxID=1734106 RepID=A0A5M6C887_9TREE|nr:uncharacterized protein CI109_000198 [Kwoniella shandongensis]KAA5531357.1 hypothetical protein CI109_000198 [Kwoniella shandongensis]